MSRGSSRAAAKSTRSATRSKAAPRSRSKRETHVTADHEEIRRWADERGGQPARVAGTGASQGDVGLIRLEFPGAPNTREASLEPISWEDWFDEFDKKNLALIYEESTARGKKSNFNKLVSRQRAVENPV